MIHDASMPTLLAQAAMTTEVAASPVSVGVSVAAAVLLGAVLTSFAKFTMIAAAVAHGLGASRLPSAWLGASWALLLTAVVMWPVWDACSAGWAKGGLQPAAEPLAAFLTANSDPDSIASFERVRDTIATRAGAEATAADPVRRVLTVAGPAFMVTEFTEAFMSVLFVLVPFLVIDLVVTNLLLACGATSTPPAVVSLPLKILAFVLMDGWRLVVQGVVLGYAY